MGRRWGKTVMGGAITLGVASQGGRAAWIVPIFKNGRSLWSWAQATAAPLRKAGLCSIDKSERTIDFVNGGYFGIYSADNEDSIRGDAFHLVVLDEAARIRESAWYEAIQPTLADYNGDAIIISTPRGRNWFYNEWIRGQGSDPEYKSWIAPTSANPNPNIKHAAERARTQLPELVYRQEWCAEFVDFEGSVFRRIQEAIYGAPLEQPEDGRQYIAGVDVASSVDYTVASVFDTQAKRMVYMDRFNRVDYPVLEERLHALYKRWHLQSMTIESNSIGQGVIDHLAARGMAIIPFTTTNATKQGVVVGLQSAFEHGDLSIADYPVLVSELLSFESKRNASGSFSYSAPDGLHDDCVMSLAIGWDSIGGKHWFVS